MPASAYLLTWTTYGSRLHGDPRGTIDDAHNTFGHEHRLGDDVTWHENAKRLSEAPLALNLNQRRVVESTVLRVADHRNWRVDALHVGETHVHVVISHAAHEPAEIAKQFKSWATRDLREARVLDDRTRVWSKMASTRLLHTAQAHAAAVDYVRRFQSGEFGRERYEPSER